MLIVGLGNPGPEYEETRHNVGFMAVDRICAKAGPVLATESRWNCDIKRVRVGGSVKTLAKPLTYMNRSGDAVGKLVRALDLRAAEVFVIYDCLDLPLGRMRIRKSGGSGGHRGMESVLGVLATSDVPRLRIGIGRSQELGVVDHVLSAWERDERDVANRAVDVAADAVIVACRAGIERAMNTYNRWSYDGSDENIDETKQSEIK